MLAQDVLRPARHHHNMVIQQVTFRFSVAAAGHRHPLHKSTLRGELGQGNRGRAVEIGNHVALQPVPQSVFRAVITGDSAQSVR